MVQVKNFEPKLRAMVILMIMSHHFLSAQVEHFSEREGMVAVEAEDFAKQYKDEVRKWFIVSADAEDRPELRDLDTAFFQTASSRAYLEILPDTRTNHDEKLIHGENFSNKPGVVAIIEYPIHFTTTGRYYVWVRAHSTGTEDNGIHVGLDGEWPESGQRMQWCDGKHQWTWASKQRTKEEHCGVERLIYLDIEKQGLHTIAFSMREDGFEFDKFIMSTEYTMPSGEGPPAETYR